MFKCHFVQPFAMRKNIIYGYILKLCEQKVLISVTVTFIKGRNFRMVFFDHWNGSFDWRPLICTNSVCSKLEASAETKPVPYISSIHENYNLTDFVFSCLSIQ